MKGRKNTHVFVRQRADKLRLAARQLSLPLEQLDGDVDLVLLQAELREGRDRCFALGVDAERLLAALLGSADVLLPLEERETLVDEGEHVHRWRPVQVGSQSLQTDAQEVYYLEFSISIAFSNFSTASWKRPWSSRSSPLYNSQQRAPRSDEEGAY